MYKLTFYALLFSVSYFVCIDCSILTSIFGGFKRTIKRLTEAENDYTDFRKLGHVAEDFARL